MKSKDNKAPRRPKKSFRLWVQIGFAALTNGYVNGFLQSKIYTGPTKALCVPGLNCYSCPGALGACPIGSLQAVIGSRNYQFSFYVIGFLVAVGALCGRFICGFLCPFGLVQDLLHKIPVPKLKRLPGEKYLKYLKYVILAVFVLLLPMFAVNIIGQGDPWFCKWICPSGTLLGGIPLVAGNPDLQAAIGWLFSWKVFLLLSILMLSMFAYRPFCKFLCPLGAIYGVFNPISLYHLRLDENKCVNCGLCERTCKMGIDPRKTPNSPECIRCGDCVRACPTGALTKGFGIDKKAQASACAGSCASCGKSCAGSSALKKTKTRTKERKHNHEKATDLTSGPEPDHLAGRLRPRGDIDLQRRARTQRKPGPRTGGHCEAAADHRRGAGADGAQRALYIR